MNLWQDKLSFSFDKIQSDIQIIKNYFPRCVDVQKTNIDEDKQGYDYRVNLSGGASILIDAKARQKGSRYFWKHGQPELALEVFSVVESKSTGWTLNTATPVDYIMYTFDADDTDKSFMLPFQLLRKVFFENAQRWKNEYGIKKQDSNSWHSAAIFVPAAVVINAINNALTIRR